MTFETEEEEDLDRHTDFIAPVTFNPEYKVEKERIRKWIKDNPKLSFRNEDMKEAYYFLGEIVHIN